MINTDNPKYQRLLQRMQAMTPYQRAILDTAVLDENFADQDMKKYIQSMQAGQAKKNQEAQISLGEQRLELNKKAQADRYALGQQQLGLRQDAMDYASSQAKQDSLLGLADIGVSGLIGYGDYLADQKKEKRLLDRAALFRQALGGE